MWTKVNQFIFAQKTPCEVFKSHKKFVLAYLYLKGIPTWTGIDLGNEILCLQTGMIVKIFHDWSGMGTNRSRWMPAVSNVSSHVGVQQLNKGSRQWEDFSHRMRHIQRPLAPFSFFTSYDSSSSWYSTISFKLPKQI